MRTIALISDLHVARGPRFVEGQRVHRAVVDILRERAVDGILIGGDFHDAATRAEERLEGASLLTEFADVAPVVGVGGNHDAPRELTLYNRLAARHPIRFYEQPTVHLLTPDVAIAALPWLREAPALELLRATPAERRAAEAVALAAMLRGLGDQLDATGAGTKLLLGHLMLREASIALGQPEPRGGEFVLGLEDLGLVRAHAHLLGHVHRGQNFEINGAAVYYPGSTHRRTFGEVERKYIGIFYVDGPDVAVEWVETPATPMLLTETAWKELEPGRWGFDLDLDDLLAAGAGADIRLRYDVPDPQREAAARAAEAIAAQLLAVGAKLCKPEERVAPVLRARAPEIATTSSLREKVAIALRIRGVEDAAPQHARTLALFDAINTGAERVGAAAPPARLHSIRLRGIGPSFREEAVLDVDALPGELIAITGPNGAGKSTLLECWAAAMHPDRELPTRGRLDDLAEGKDAFLEVETSGHDGRHRIRFEPNMGTADIWLDGADLGMARKVSRAADWARASALPPEVFDAAVFLSQRSEGLIAADRAARRRAFLRAIGVEPIEALAKTARAKAAEVTREIEDLQREIAQRRAHPDAAAARAAAAARRDASVLAHDDARAALTAARESATAAAAREAVESRHAAAAGRLAELQGRRDVATALLAGADEIRQRAARVRELEGQIAERFAVVATLRTEAATAAAAVEFAARGAEGARRRFQEARARLRAAEGRLTDAAAVEAAVAALPALRTAVEAASAAAAGAETRAAELRAAATEAAAGRTDALRTAMGEVWGSSTIAGAKDIARGALDADDAAVAAMAADLLRGLDDEIGGKRALFAAAQVEMNAAAMLAARAADVAASSASAAAARIEMEAAEKEGRAAVEQETAATAERRAADLRAAEAEEERAGLARDVAAARAAGADESEIAGAEARVATITEQIATTEAEIATIAVEIAALPPAPPRADPEAADRALAAASREMAAASAALALADRAVDVAVENDIALRAAEDAAAALAEREADSILLADVLGISGVQALEIDAAGPAITTAMNELLHGAYGSRFSAEVSASRPKKDKGGGTVDDIQILVLDTEKKTPRRDVRTFSGGERVPLTTGFALALAIYLCRSRGLAAPTIVLDEPGSGIDDEPGNAARWIDMVRIAGRMARASQIIVIAHDHRVIAAADTVVEIRDGAITTLRTGRA